MKGDDKAFAIFITAMFMMVVILGTVDMMTRTYCPHRLNQTKPNPNMTTTKIIDCMENCTIRIKLIKE